MNAIVAVNDKWGIGKDRKLLYRIPEDMQFFRKMTAGKIVVMGRKTLESLPNGQPLKNRINIVLSSGLKPENGIIVCRSIDELEKAVSGYDSDDVFVIGGGEVYRRLISRCKRAYITKVIDNKPFDVSFPNLDENPDWNCIYTSELRENDGIRYCFTTYENTGMI